MPTIKERLAQLQKAGGIPMGQRAPDQPKPRKPTPPPVTQPPSPPPEASQPVTDAIKIEVKPGEIPLPPPLPTGGIKPRWLPTHMDKEGVSSRATPATPATPKRERSRTPQQTAASNLAEEVAKRARARAERMAKREAEAESPKPGR